MVTLGRPLNVRALPPVSIASTLARLAMWAAPIVSGALPNALLSTTRTRAPPRLVWTICRSV